MSVSHKKIEPGYHPIQRLSMVRFWMPQMLSCTPTNLYNNSPKYQLEATKIECKLSYNPQGPLKKLKPNPSIPQPRNQPTSRRKSLTSKGPSTKLRDSMASEDSINSVWRRFRGESCPWFLPIPPM